MINKIKCFFTNKVLMKLNKKRTILILLSISFLILLIVNKNPYIFTNSKITISEVVTCNNYYFSDKDGDFPDWIEIKNSSENPVNLNEYGLSDNENKPRKWVFPDIILEPNEYILVFASGKNSNNPKDELHTNFRLSSEGETLILSKTNSIVQKISLPKMTANVSYGRSKNGNWKYFSSVTPGKDNSEHYYDNIEDTIECIVGPSKILINEYMASKQKVLYDEDGDFSDWIEIINVSENSVSLKNYSLTDNSNEPLKWIFPDVSLESGECIVVFASGKSKANNNEGNYHTSFKLDPTSEQIILYDPKGLMVDEVNIISHPSGVSHGRLSQDKSKWEYFSKPTPGKINDEISFPTLKQASTSMVNSVYITEVMPTNTSTLIDGFGKYSDWIELYNSSDKTISLKGYGLSDDIQSPSKYILPEISIEPNSYIIIHCSGHGTTDKYGRPHTNFKIDTAEKEIYLSNSNGIIIDYLNIGKCTYNITVGKMEGSLERRYFSGPTPGKINNSNNYIGYTDMPNISVKGGQYKDKILVNISSKSEYDKIYYTLDGSIPTSNSSLYKEPISISKTTVLRAVAIRDGYATSPVITETYLYNTNHDLPIVCLSANPVDLFDKRNGIYIKYTLNKEVPVHFELFDNNNKGIDFDAGLKIFGRVSRTQPQKSFAIDLNEAYGIDQITYPLFPNEEEGVTDFSSFVLRASGNDWDKTHFLDGMLMSLIQEDVNTDVMSYRPAVLYINGKYWGIYNFRDKLNSEYLETHHNVDENNVNILESNWLVCEGSNEDYKNLIKYIKTHNLRNDEYYKYVISKIDLNSFIDHVIINVYFDNYDSGNLKYWSEKEENGKWRWMTFDMDWAMFYPKRNTLALRTDPEGHGSLKYYDTTLINGLLKNKEFRSLFVNRFAELMNTTFKPDNMLEHMDNVLTSIEKEMPNQLSRWGLKEYEWNKHVSRIRDFIKKRPSYMKKHIKNYFKLSNDEMNKLFK